MGGFRCSLKVNLRHDGRPHVLQCRSVEVHTSIRAAQDDAADVMLAAIGQLTGEVSEGRTAAAATASAIPICMEEPAAASPSSSLLLRILGALAAYQNRLSEELAKVEMEYERDPPRAICTATRISLQQRRVANRMRLIGDRYIASLAALERTFPPPVVPAFTQQPTSPARGVGATSLPLTMQLPLGAEEQSRPSRSSSSEGMLCGTPSPSRSIESSTASSASSEMISMQQHTPEQLRFSSPVAVTRQSTPSSGSSRKSSHKKCEVPECTRLARGVGPQARRCASHGGGRRCFCGRVARGSSSYCGTHGGGRRCQQEGCTSGAAGASNFCVTHGGGRRCSVAECPKASCAKSDRCFEHGGGRRCSYEGCGRGAVGLTEYCIRHGGGKRCGFEGCTKGAVSGGFCVRHGNQVNGTPSRGLQGTSDADTPPGSAVISPATSIGSSYGEVMAGGSLEWTGSSQVAWSRTSMTHAAIDADSEQWCQDLAFSATAVVVATEQAKEVVWQAHRMSIPQLLQPFGGYYTPLTVQARTNGRPRQVEGFRIRFVATEEASQVPESIAQDQSAKAFAACVPQDGQSLEGTSPPWFDAWLSSEVTSLAFSDHECISQPLATVLVASTSVLEPAMADSGEAADPIQSFEQLMHESNMPPLARRGVLDPDAARMKVLIHDPSKAPPGLDLDALLSLMQKTYSPQSCFILVVGEASEPPVPDIQALFRRNPFPPVLDEYAATGVQWSEIDDLQRLGTAIVTECAVPWAERKLAELDETISLKRKGFRNAFSRFLRKPNLPGTEVINGPIGSGQGEFVTTLCLEWQIRLAGDLAFHLRDYPQALAYYRQVTPDFKQDHQWGVAAGAYEMSAVAAWLSHISSGGEGVAVSEVSRYMDNAVELYRKAGPRFYRHAMRAAIIQSAILRGRVESPQRLLKANGDIPDAGLRCALILERAARLQRDAGQLRKMCFHLVLAGHTFNKAGYKQWALACYKAVVPEYAGKGWTHITDHLLFTMAKQTFALGDTTKSIAYFTDLFNSITLHKDARSTISVAKQHNYLKGFLYVLRSRYGKELLDVPPEERVDVILPKVSIGDVSTTVGQPLHRAASDGAEEAAAGRSDSVTFTNHPIETEVESWGSICGLSPDTDRAPADDSGVILVGQRVYATLVVTNPLQIPIDITDIRLDFEDPTLVDSSLGEPIHLEGDQMATVRVDITPRVVGKIVVTGAQWVLDNTAPCCWTCPKELRVS
ncbi:Trafficking protein particle complex 8, partial [Perkinsus olseni]